jgi:hypothetical protein
MRLSSHVGINNIKKKKKKKKAKEIKRVVRLSFKVVGYLLKEWPMAPSSFKGVINLLVLLTLREWPIGEIQLPLVFKGIVDQKKKKKKKGFKGSRSFKGGWLGWADHRSLHSKGNGRSLISS